MRNTKLSNLNFQRLLKYGGQPTIKNTYNPPLECKGYCISCEEKGVFNNDNDSFDQMSHGCDTSDFEVLLGKIDGNNFDPIMFLLENPGGDYKNGNVVSYKGYNKQPPVNHYYWTPNIQSWPEHPYSLPHLYGPYFAYLMKRHRLNNVYITNLIKCNTIASNRKEYNKPAAIENCTDKWLKEELEIFSPKHIFCFGRNAEKGLQKTIKKYGISVSTLYLYHPSAISLSQRYKKRKKNVR